MARVNFEDDLHKDHRFIKLIMKLGSREAAIGALAICWTVAQKYWKQSDNGIPKADWIKQALKNEIIEVGLAEDKGDFIYVKGSKEAFSWLRQCADAGKAGGKARATKRKQTKRGQPDADPPEASLSLSFSDSPSESKSHCLYNDERTADADAPVIKSPVGFFIANYVNAYQARYGEQARPELSGKVQGQIKRFLKETPLERACDLIQVFLQMNDSWFVNKCHDFTTFISNINKVALALDTNQSITGTRAREIERVSHNSDVFDRAADRLGYHDEN